MRYKTFRNIVLGGVAVLGATGVFFLAKSCKDQPHAVTRPPLPTPPPPPTPTPSDAIALRPMDEAIFRRIDQGITGDKVKDAFKEQAYKVNLYRDPGAPGVNRVKIDLDRDEKWDEKWTIEGGEIKRQVSPTDDDQTYSEEYVLTPKGWVRRGETAAATPTSESTLTPEPEPTPTPEPGAYPAEGAGSDVSDLHRQILAAIDRPISGDKVKDALPGSGAKVNLYRDAGFTQVNRLKVDLDGDGKWDEKWTIEREGGDTQVKRQVAPADDERYTEEYSLRAGAWVRNQP